jgi:xylan 1,4-beta-xylosidase
MKKLTFIVIGLFIFFNIYCQSPSFKTYVNTVIPGDHPDCTVTKVGNDFYTTGSSFNVTPTIYHSTDLVHWEAIARPVSASWSIFDDKPGAGCWGGQMVFYKGKYWDYFSRANTMYFVIANDPKGLWSEPVKVNNPSNLTYGLGYDNSIFIDDNNKWYLVVKNGRPNNGIVELGDDGQPTGIVYDLNWLNPQSKNFPYSWAEGPVMWKCNGYYYYSFARDLAGGQKVMRSKILSADESSWEMLGDLFNENDPDKSSATFAGPNHASAAVKIDDGTSWLIHPLYAEKEWKGQGRQGLLNQVRYIDDKPIADYPTNRYFTSPKLPDSGIQWMVPHTDYFDTDQLNPEWSFLGYTPSDKYSLTDRKGWLRLTPKSASKANTLTKNDGEHNYSLITKIDFTPNSESDEAGLWVLSGDETKYVKLYSTLYRGSKKVMFSYEGEKFTAENIPIGMLWLKIIRVNHELTGFYSFNGTEWIQVGKAFDVSYIDSHSDFTSFTGTRQGLFVAGTSDAWFDQYIYRDAYTPILAECPANWYGTTNGFTNKRAGLLSNIHNNDWVMFAGVEFGKGEMYKNLDFVEFTASSTSKGGAIEVWLDSIGKGTKIASCKIENTGSVDKFEIFKAKINQAVHGNHEVYLLFKGKTDEELFELQWIMFRLR